MNEIASSIMAEAEFLTPSEMREVATRLVAGADAVEDETAPYRVNFRIDKPSQLWPGTPQDLPLVPGWRQAVDLVVAHQQGLLQAGYRRSTPLTLDKYRETRRGPRWVASARYTITRGDNKAIRLEVWTALRTAVGMPQVEG